MMKVLCVTLGLVALALAKNDNGYEPNVYNVTQSFSEKVCLSVQVAAQFTVTDQKKTAQFNLPRTNSTTWTSVTGHCYPEGEIGEHRVTLTVKFAVDDVEKDHEKFEMAFNVTASTPGNYSDWSLVEISLTYSPKSIFKANSSGSVTVSNTDPGISSSNGAPYKCARERKLNLEDSQKHVVLMKIKDLVLYPVIEKGRTVEECKPTKRKTDKVVPIAVGCALAGLLLIVIIAWLVGRNSGRAGYKEV